jgi:hypothetical protein
MTTPTALRIGIPASASHSRVAKPPALNPLKVNLKALDKWIDQQKEPTPGPRLSGA